MLSVHLFSQQFAAGDQQGVVHALAVGLAF
jgi:hypothetical protein